MSEKMGKEGSVRSIHGLARRFWPDRLRKRILYSVIALGILTSGTTIADVYLRNLFPFLDFSGFSATNSTTGSVDLSSAFFQSLGTNGRSCGTCHAPSDGFGLSAVDAQIRYFLSRGKDPLFAQFDGSTCPTGTINNSLSANYRADSHWHSTSAKPVQRKPSPVYDRRGAGPLRLCHDDERARRDDGFHLSPANSYNQPRVPERGDV